MSEALLGIIALLAGLLFCFRGNVALRVVISVWGAFVGFHLGAALVSAATGQPPLGEWAGWVAAILGALLFALLAYTFYSLAVIIGAGSVGFGIGADLAMWFGAGEWIAILAGIAVGIVLAVVALLTGLPDLLIILVSAIGGAAAIVSGALLLASAVGVHPDLDQWLLHVVWFVIAIVGIIVQSRLESTRDVRSQWGRRAGRR